ncbi:MAG: GAF domain-containing protein [candidate division Zixibacteria bacterium]|nr:GAF domain-containing protein [candidate division Zixibacteria bacterium]
MPFTNKGPKSLERTDKFILPISEESEETENGGQLADPLARMEKSVSAITKARPHLSRDQAKSSEISNYQMLLEISAAINSTLVTDEILQIVIKRVIKLLKAERGFLMLLDENNELQFRTVHNLRREEMLQEDFKFSRSIANQVAATGESIYTSDAQTDERYSSNKSVSELNLRSIMCVSLKIKDKAIGVIYLDNSTQACLFLESDLYLLELFATQAAIALNNSRLYEKIVRLKRYNENIVSNSPVGLIVLNSRLEIMTINSSAEKIFGSTQNRGERLDTLLGGDVPARWLQGCRNVIANGIDEALPRSYLTIGETEKVLSVKISPLEEVDRSGRGVIIVIEDITEKVILENYVAVSEKLIAKGEAAASVGHELNNFLAIIFNNAELVQMRLMTGQHQKAEESCNAILAGVDKMKRFTEDLMDISNLKQERVTYNINHVIDDLLFSVKTQPRFKDVTFVVRSNPELPDCEIDVGQIQQVFVNLLYNAADALHDKKDKREIRITISSERGKVITTVRDNGSGISPGNLPHIFEPHFSTKPEGHGLGLANCKRIVEGHSGTITVDSKLHHYSEFRVALPKKK